MGLKLKWRVQPQTTGRYKSFQRRGWPSADYHNGECAASLSCSDEYYPSEVKTGNHHPITIRIAFYNVERGFDWKTLTAKGTTLKEAKQIAEDFINKYPQIQPKREI